MTADTSGLVTGVETGVVSDVPGGVGEGLVPGVELRGASSLGGDAEEMLSEADSVSFSVLPFSMP